MKYFATLILMLASSTMIAAPGDDATRLAVAVEITKQLKQENTLLQIDVDTLKTKNAELEAQNKAAAILADGKLQAEQEKTARETKWRDEKIDALQREDAKPWAHAAIAAGLLLGIIAGISIARGSIDAAVAWGIGGGVSLAVGFAMLQYPEWIGRIGLIVPAAAVLIAAVIMVDRARRQHEKDERTKSDLTHAAALPIRAQLIAPAEEGAARALMLNAVDEEGRQLLDRELSP